MPTIKRNLSRSEILANLARARRMYADGVDIQVCAEWEEAARSLDIVVGGGSAAMVFDLKGGSAGYAIWVRLVARRRITLRDCRLLTAWDKEITLVGYFDDREPIWWLGDLDFPRRQVLNPRIMNDLRFHGCDYTVEGVILATGLKPIPEACHHGMTVPFTPVFEDQNGNEISQDSMLFVDRTWKRKRRAARPRTSLFDPVEILAMPEPFSENSGVLASPQTTPAAKPQAKEKIQSE
jgi:hypothetical protein